MCCMQGINASVEVINTVKCNVDLDKIINIKGFQLEKVLELDPNFLDVCLSLCEKSTSARRQKCSLHVDRRSLIGVEFPPI